MMAEDNTNLIIELIRSANEKLTAVERRMSNMEGLQLESIKDRQELRGMVISLQEHTRRISKTLGAHKKKGLFALIAALFSGAAIASGSLNYQSIVDKLIGALKGGH
jgi:hypothetical protein